MEIIKKKSIKDYGETKIKENGPYSPECLFLKNQEEIQWLQRHILYSANVFDHCRQRNGMYHTHALKEKEHTL